MVKNLSQKTLKVKSIVLTIVCLLNLSIFSSNLFAQEPAKLSAQATEDINKIAKSMKMVPEYRVAHFHQQIF
jgi:hypothetical protein